MFGPTVRNGTGGIPSGLQNGLELFITVAMPAAPNEMEDDIWGGFRIETDCW